MRKIHKTNQVINVWCVCLVGNINYYRTVKTEILSHSIKILCLIVLRIHLIIFNKRERVKRAIF